MDDKLLALDLSTTCTGFAVFDLKTRTLEETGRLRPTTKGGVAKMVYPKQQLTKIKDLSSQIVALIERVRPQIIVIEEIAGSKNRLGQKTLDAMHGILWLYIEEHLDKVTYYDVTGNQGWRFHLQLRLSEADKLANKEAKRLNKKLTPAQQIPIIGPKHLAQRYVNATFGLSLNVDTAPTDADVGDAVAMGAAFLSFRFAKAPKFGIV